MGFTTATILADSRTKTGDRIITYRIKFPRIIEAEILRHRMFSYSASSSRARNLEKHLQDTIEELYVPSPFTKDQKGMSAREVLQPLYDNLADHVWKECFDKVVETVETLGRYNVHKQHASRLLQPFEYQEMIMTGTEWWNFFNLRCPKYRYKGQNFFSKKDLLAWYPEFDGDFNLINESTAQPEIQELAEMMYTAYHESSPLTLEEGEWHIPLEPDYSSLRGFLDPENVKKEFELDYDTICRKVACARIARISYLNESNDYQKDIDLFDKLVKMKHWSPLEHVCRVMDEGEYAAFYRNRPGECEYGWCDNYRGFISLRYSVENGTYRR